MKWTPTRVGLAAVTTITGLYGRDAAMPRKGELAPFPQRVSFEEHISRQLPELSCTAGRATAETGGGLTMMDLSYMQAYGIGNMQDYQVIGYNTVAPQISFDRLGEVMNTRRCDDTPNLWMQDDSREDGNRRIYFTDNDGDPAQSKYTEIGIETRSHSACLPSSHSLSDPSQSALPSVEEAFPSMHVTVNDNTGPDLHPVPVFTLGAQVDPQSGVESSTRSDS